MAIQDLEVYYSADFIDSVFDEKIEEKIKELGFRRWASGYNLIENKRDLAFTRREKKTNKSKSNDL